jgi:hypothetical protein
MLLKMGVETETRIRRTVAARTTKVPAINDREVSGKGRKLGDKEEDEPGVAGLIPIL